MTFANAWELARVADDAPSHSPYVLACPACGAPRASRDDLRCRSCGGHTTE